MNTSETIATSTSTSEEPQQVVIMTRMAEGLVADVKDLEQQAQEIEATATTTTALPEEEPVISKREEKVAFATNNDSSGSNTFRSRFAKKDWANDTSPPPATTTSTNSSPFIIPPATKAPKETLKAIYGAGKYKAGLTWNVLAVQSFMAGVYVAFAGQLYLSVGGGVLGAALFPAALIAVVLTSAELFTGDALVFVASVLGGQVRLRFLVRNWTMSWICNFIGCISWAFVLGYLSHAIEDTGGRELAIKVAKKKALQDLSHIFFKAIGANFMVCVAVWQGTSAEEVAGKILALWFPVAAFVMMGFEHVVANMFFIPMGMMLGADVSVGRMFAALFIATMGNAIGGGIFVGAIYWYVFDSMASFSSLTTRIQQSMRNIGMGHHSRAEGAASRTPSGSDKFDERELTV